MTDNLGPYLLGPNDTPENGIYIGDARELAQAIPDGSVDIVFTSPPYNAGLNYGSWDDDLPEDEFWAFQEEWVREAARVATRGARMYATISEFMLWRFKKMTEANGWRYHQLLSWCKPNLAGTARISGDWNRMTEFCLLFHKEIKVPMLNTAWGINTHNWIVTARPQSNFTGDLKKYHVAQMALKVAFAWLARTPGDVVYEPFAGSGTTCIAAYRLGKRWLAFEIDASSAALARYRVRQCPPLFVPLREQLAMGL